LERKAPPVAERRAVSVEVDLPSAPTDETEDRLSIRIERWLRRRRHPEGTPLHDHAIDKTVGAEAPLRIADEEVQAALAQKRTYFSYSFSPFSAVDFGDVGKYIGHGTFALCYAAGPLALKPGSAAAFLTTRFTAGGIAVANFSGVRLVDL
jgi:hypothetical protein